MEIKTAQLQLRSAYLSGGPGAIVSGLVWLSAGVTASVSGVKSGFVVLFFGGMLIFPIASFIVRGLLRREPVPKDNPGGLTVIETIFPMMGGLLAAWLLLPYRPEFVFPMAAIAVGAHYFGFRTAYGDRTNWVLGASLCLVGIASIFWGLPNAQSTPFTVAAIEVSFGAWLTWRSLKSDKQEALTGTD